MLSQEEQIRLIESISKAELNTSGEIRLHIDKKCPVDVLDRASDVFEELKMHKTELRNGVLFYLAIDDKKFAILGDVGINQKVDKNFWNENKELVLSHFKEGNLVKGLSAGIKMAGEQLQVFFPYQSDDLNELSNQISFGDE
jgi:uncharacterized membrane protein